MAYNHYAVEGAQIAKDINTLYLTAKRWQSVYNAVLSAEISVLGNDDPVFGTTMTKSEFVSAANFINQLVSFIEAGNPAAGDYRATIAVLEAWHRANTQ